MTSAQQRRAPSFWNAITVNPVPMLWVAVIYTAYAVLWSLWLGGNLAASITGDVQVPAQGIGMEFLFQLVEARGPAGIWTETSPSFLYLASGGFALLLVGVPMILVVILARRAGQKSSFSGLDEFDSFTRARRSSEAERLQRSESPFDAKRVSTVGVPIGQLDGTDLLAGLEDVMVTIAGPRSGKTTRLSIPQTLAAAGPCITTSNKHDIVAGTRQLREDLGSPTWVFDPTGIALEPSSWWWSPLQGIQTHEDASRLARIFVPERPDDKNAFFTNSARDYLTHLILAAALTDRTMRDLQRWIYDQGDMEPITALSNVGLPDASGRLAAMVTSKSPETLADIVSTARTATACLNSEALMEWITPHRDRPQFSIPDFYSSNATLYLLSKEGEMSAAPIIAAFTNRVLRYGEQLAASQPNGRLSPHLTVVLDEAANIVKIGDLPDLYSHYGSRGIVVNTILQSLAQASAVWGKTGAEKLWGAATVKLVGSGIDDPNFGKDLAALLGKRELDVVSYSANSRYGGGSQLSSQKEDIWDASDVRQISKGQALLIATALPPTLIELPAWYETRDRPAIENAIATFERKLEVRASQQLERTN